MGGASGGDDDIQAWRGAPSACLRIDRSKSSGVGELQARKVTFGRDCFGPFLCEQPPTRRPQVLRTQHRVSCVLALIQRSSKTDLFCPSAVRKEPLRTASVVWGKCSRRLEVEMLHSPSLLDIGSGVL